MSQQLVRVRIGDREVTVGAAFAKSKGLQVLDEPARREDGTTRPETRAGGRPVKPKTSVSTEAAKKNSPAAVIEPAPNEKG